MPNNITDLDNNSRKATAFDLELNPFEQSFASNKIAGKPNDLNNGFNRNDDIVQGSSNNNIKNEQKNNNKISPDNFLNSSRVPSNLGDNSSGKPGDDKYFKTSQDGKRPSLLMHMQRSSFSNSNVHGANGNNNNAPGTFSFSGLNKFGVPSPSLLTPGGSKKLPPLLLSPSFIEQSNKNALINNGPPTNGTLGSTSKAGNFGLENPSLNLFFTLNKSDLTPNESSVRNDLNSNTARTSNNTTPSITTYPLANQQVTTTNGSHSNLLTPGISSLLGIPSVPQANNFNMGQQHIAHNNNNNNNNNVVEPDSTINMIPTKTNINTTKQRHDSNNNNNISQDKHTTNIKKEKKDKNTIKQINNTKVLHPRDEREDEAETDASKERKRQDFLERNRVAASRFRKRRKEYVHRIEMELQMYDDAYMELANIMTVFTGVQAKPSTDTAYIPTDSNPNIKVEANMNEGDLKNSALTKIDDALLQGDIPTARDMIRRLADLVTNTGFVRRKGQNPKAIANFQVENSMKK